MVEVCADNFHTDSRCHLFSHETRATAKVQQPSGTFKIERSEQWFLFLSELKHSLITRQAIGFYFLPVVSIESAHSLFYITFFTSMASDGMI